MNALTEVPIASLQELHRVAEANGWTHVCLEVEHVVAASSGDRDAPEGDA